MDLDVEKVRRTALSIISQVVKEGKLQENSLKAIRKKAEDAMDLEHGCLDEAPYKSAVKEVVQNYIASHGEEGASPEEEKEQKSGPSKSKKSSAATKSEAAKPRQPRTSAPKAKGDGDTAKKVSKGKRPARSASVVPTSDEGEEANSTSNKPKPRKKPSGKSKRVESDDASSEADEPDRPTKRLRNSPIDETTPTNKPETLRDPPPDERQSKVDGEKSESEMSVLIDDEPPARKRKKKVEPSAGSSRTGKSATKSRKREPAKELSKDEETIKRLKALVVACGVRKVWSKEFKDSHTPSDQIHRLRQILTSLGMSGRMSLEQAKAIKEKREFEKELEDVQEFAQKFESSSRHRSQKSTTAEAEFLDSSDVEMAPKRRPTARQSIMAFLGDEESE